MAIVSWEENLPARYAHVIDARSPAEHAEDRLPGAWNLPVLNDAERATVGEIYVQQDAFAGRRLGAAMVARNVAHHLDTALAGVPQSARLLIYCWRGGQRSRSMATILNAVGWEADVLAGGYKNWRAWVRKTLDELAAPTQCRVVAGLTGAGKSRILRAMARQGAQVLDLEDLGQHRGSLLGDEPDCPQPSQKAFESALLQQMSQFDLTKPVWVESESKRIGALRVPEILWHRMLAAPVHEVESPLDERAAFLVREYGHFLTDPESLSAKLGVLVPQQGHGRIDAWRSMITAGDWLTLSREMLEHHYDPSYRRARKFAAPCCTHTAPDHSEAGIAATAAEILMAAAGSPTPLAEVAHV